MGFSRQSSHEDDEFTLPPEDRKGAELGVASRIKLVPEGEWGWVICAAAFLSQFIVMGIHNSFGILYTKLLEEYKKSKAQTAWVGSVSIGVMYLFGPITSGLCERLGCRVVAFLGGLLCILGLLLTSFVSDLPKLYVTYGFLWGVGSSFCYFPTLTVPGDYFCRRLSLVNGIVTAGLQGLTFLTITGSGIGTLTFGPVLQYILEKYTLVTCLQILSGVSGVLLVTSLTYKPLRSPLEELLGVRRHPGPFIDITIWRNKAFCVYTGAVALFMLGYFIPFVHLVSHAEGMGIQQSKAGLLIGFMSISSTISRLVLGKFSDHPRVNRLYMTQAAIVGFAVTTTLCPLANSYAALVAVVVALGVFDGLYVVLIAVLNTDIVGVHKLSQALGNLYGVISLPIALGPPFAGFIFDMLHSYHTAFYICGATTTLCACLMFLIPWLMPNQHGGVLHRDSCQSRLESLLSIRASSPVSSENLTKFLEDSVNGSSTKQSDFEADRIERDYLEGFASGRADDDAWDTADFSESQILSLSTSLNTAFNSSMSQRGSITKALLQHHSLSRTPTPNLRRGSLQSASPEVSFNGCLGGSRRGSDAYSYSLSATNSRSGTWKRSSRSSSRSSQTEIRSAHTSESSDFSAASIWERRTAESTKKLPEQPQTTAVRSGHSTVVCSHGSSVMRMVGNQDTALSSDPTQNRNMLDLLAARLLQTSRLTSEHVEQTERESVV